MGKKDHFKCDKPSSWPYSHSTKAPINLPLNKNNDDDF